MAIGSSVITIGNYAFSGCRKLTNITIPDNVSTIGSYAFQYCDSLANVIMGTSVSYIGSFAFENCYGLLSVVIPDNVTDIGNWAFGGCTNLARVTIGNGVTTIGSYAFYWCSTLTVVYFTGDAPAPDASVFENSPATIYYLPNTIGWGDTYSTRPAKLWNPTFTFIDINAGIMTYTIAGTPEIPIAIEVRTNLLSGEWTRLSTTNLTEGFLNIQISRLNQPCCSVLSYRRPVSGAAELFWGSPLFTLNSLMGQRDQLLCMVMTLGM